MLNCHPKSLFNRFNIGVPMAQTGYVRVHTRIAVVTITLKFPAQGKMSVMAILRQLRLRSVVKDKGLDPKPFGHNPRNDAAAVYFSGRFLSFLEL